MSDCIYICASSFDRLNKYKGHHMILCYLFAWQEADLAKALHPHSIDKVFVPCMHKVYVSR